MAWSGPTAAAFVDSLVIHQPIGSIEVATQYQARLHNILSRNIAARGLTPQKGGEYANLRQITRRPVAFSGRREAKDVIFPFDETPATGTVTLKQGAGAVGWTIEEFEDAQGDPQILDELVTGRWDGLISGIGQVLNALDYGDGTGRLARVSAATDNTTYYSITVDNTCADFGWDGLALVENGMLVDIYTMGTNISGTGNVTVQCAQCEVRNVDKTAKTFDVYPNSNITKSGLFSAPADSDFVFLAGSFNSSAQHATYGYETGTLTAPACWNFWPGLGALIADGVSTGNEFSASGTYNGSYFGATFQGLTRSASTMFNAQIMRASDWKSGQTDGTKYAATLDAVNQLFDKLFTQNGQPDPLKLLAIMSPKTYRWAAAKVVSEQNGWQQVPDGHVLSGLGLRGFRVTQGSSGREVIVPAWQAPEVPDGKIIVPDLGRIGLWERVPLGPTSPDGKSTAQFAAPGSRNFTIERWARTRAAMFSARCDTSGSVEDVDVDS